MDEITEAFGLAFFMGNEKAEIKKMISGITYQIRDFKKNAYIIKKTNSPAMSPFIISGGVDIRKTHFSGNVINIFLGFRASSSGMPNLFQSTPCPATFWQKKTAGSCSLIRCVYCALLRPRGYIEYLGLRASSILRFETGSSCFFFLD
jgi:hypothetical protein